MEKAMWKKYDKLTDKCYDNMIGVEPDGSCWEKAFDLLMEIVRTERKTNPGFASELSLLDDETDYEHDISGWLEDCLDEIDMREQHEVLLKMCETLLDLFSWPDNSGSDLKFRKSIVLRRLGRVDEGAKFCEQWLQKEPENIMAATSYVYVLIDIKKYERAEQLIHAFIPDFSQCSEENEIMFLAASRYYEVIGDKKKNKQLNKAMKEYDDYVDRTFLEWCEGKDGDFDWDDIELPFN